VNGWMVKPRVMFATAVTYETLIEVLERIPRLIRDRELAKLGIELAYPTQVFVAPIPGQQAG
jgi:hypothetical protein